MITKAQEFIIKRVCKIQVSSLEEVFLNPNLGDKEKLMDILGITRKEFDKSLIGTWKNFEELHEEPEKLDRLSYYDLVVFLFILTNLRGEYGKKFPKTIHSLGKKVLSLMETNKYLN